MPQSNQCIECAHYQSQAACDAFEKIPYEIISGEVDHDKRYEGDHGIQFEPIKEPKK